MKKKLFTSVRCLECGHEMKGEYQLSQCQACGSAWLDARYEIAALPEDWPSMVAKRPTNLWRYRELLPFPPEFPVISMGEGWTPLTRAEGLEKEYQHDEIWIKDERQQPTGSFKDRQAAVTISALKAQGIKELVLASTGNAAAAYAAFCARAGIKLWVFLTSSVPAEKMRELALYGAEVIKITGTYDQAKKIASDFASRRDLYCVQGAKAIPDKESMKTVAYEIVEQLGWRAPDWYIQAVSGGLGPLGVHKGFMELHEAGLIDRIPKIGIIQVEGCAPMVHAWEKRLDKAEPIIPDTLITVLATGDPGLAYQFLKQANDQHGGAMVAVSDGEAFRAMRRLARMEGFSVEPAASVAFAGLEKMFAREYIQPDECVVVNCSGHTFSAEKHALEDRYVTNLEVGLPAAVASHNSAKELVEALEQLDEQVTTVAIIDDNPNDSRLIRRLLQNFKKYRIFEAHSGAEGIELVRQRRPDLIVLDLMLPDKDGFAILEELKSNKHTREIPVVIVSGRSLSLGEVKYLQRYAKSIWQKGNFNGRELASHVVETLGDEVTPPELSIAQANQEYSRHAGAFGQDQKPRILVIEDNVWDARLMRRLFESRQRFEVLAANTAHEAMNIIENSPPELIVLDLVLPDEDGEKLLKKLRTSEHTAHIPVIVVSGKEIHPEERTKLNLHADSVWSKMMLDRNSLLAHVETLISE